MVSKPIEDLGDYAQDVLRSTYQTFESALKRWISLLEPTEPLGRVTQAMLPKVDFDAWYSASEATGGSMAGSGRLDWPMDTNERLALQLELLRRLADGRLDWINFTHHFFYSGKYHNQNLSALLNQLVRPFMRDHLRALQRAIGPTRPASTPSTLMTSNQPNAPERPPFVDLARIGELRTLKASYDFQRLVRLCEELNICWQFECFHAVAMLTRAVLDHVPPIFGLQTFAQVASNYGGKTFKDLATFLQESARKIGDSHLHTPIRAKEVLPTATQVNVSQALDHLLAEVVRVARQP